MKRSLVLVCLLGSVACAREHPLVLDVPAGTGTLHWTVRFFATSAVCPAEPASADPPGELARELAFEGDRGPRGGALVDGAFAVVAVGRDESCAVQASGCVSIHLSSVGEIRIPTRAPAIPLACPPKLACKAGRCADEAPDDGLDGGKRDARHGELGRSAVERPARRESLRTPSLPTPCSSSGLLTPRAFAAACPGRCPKTSSAFVPSRIGLPLRNGSASTTA